MYLKWAHPSLNLDVPIVANRSLVKINNRMANSVDPDETARNEPSHLDLHCLQKYLYWSSGLKRLSCSYFTFIPYHFRPRIRSVHFTTC